MGWVQVYAPVVRTGERAYADLLFGNHSREHKSYRLAGKWNMKESQVFLWTPDGQRKDLTSSVFDTGEDAEAVGPKGVKGYFSLSFVPELPGLYLLAVEGDSVAQHAYMRVRTFRSAKACLGAAETPVREEVAGLRGCDRRVAPDRLEIVPLFNPAAVVPGQRLDFQLLFQGQPG
jgi:hypothetical protein